jgi:4-diphosphocytidyl-2-C-methyl-D-erythritol kinase
MVKIVSERAPAKVNLYLRVVGRRADGYHELDSILMPVSLYDELALEVRPAPAPSVALRCDHPALPTDDRNLAARAARRFMEEFGLSAAIAIELRKRIPAGAGLGGGSSDAAAVIRALAALTRIGDRARLMALGLTLGADVPFFIDPRPARIAGIGERVAPLANPPQLELVIAAPPVEVSTAAVFGALGRDRWSGPLAEAAALEAFGAGRIVEAMLVNDLEAVAAARHPEILRLKAILKDCGATASAMSGSGGAVFGLFPSPAAAEQAAVRMRALAPEASIFAVHTLAAPRL